MLGLEKDADDDAIRKAYRSMSRRWHPDKNPGDVQAEHMSRLINHAYIVLTSPVKRRAYDRYGTKGLEVATIRIRAATLVQTLIRTLFLGGRPARGGCL